MEVKHIILDPKFLFYFQMYQIIPIDKIRKVKTLNTYVYLPIGSIYLLIFFLVLIVVRTLVNWQRTKKVFGPTA